MILQQPFAIGGSHVRTYYRSLTIDHLQVPSTQTDFPVLVNFTDSTFKTIANGGHVYTTNAFTFSSDSGGSSLLKWEVERYNASTGEIVAWVKIASVSSGSDTVFYLRYGITITTDVSDPTNVWTSSYLGVFHLKDGTTLSVADSTVLNTATNHGATAAAGQIDGCAAFVSASSQYIDLAQNIAPTAITLSAWVNGTSFPGAFNGVVCRTNAGYTSYAAIFVKSNGKLNVSMNGSLGAASYDGGSHTLSTATWYYLCATYDSSSGTIGYVNAASDGTAAANGALLTSSANTYIGDDNNTAGRFWNGSIDEARAASIARSADWITVEYANQKPSANLIALGTET